MHTTLTVLSILIPSLLFLGAALAFVWAREASREAHGWYLKAEAVGMKLRNERDRTTVLERDVEALRRELRKLSGKFYAMQRVVIDDNTDRIEEAHVQVSTAPYCPKYELAQRDGPYSDAAKCECNYCKGRRAAKEAFRNTQRAAGHLDPEWIKAHAGSVTDNGE